MRVSTREWNQFPSVLLHPPPLASEFSASYGVMSRRSGCLSAVARSAEVDAAKADNHSDFSPFDSLRSLRAGRLRFNELRTVEKSLSQICDVS